MNNRIYGFRGIPGIVASVFLAATVFMSVNASAEDSEEIDAAASKALESLYASTPAAVEISKVAKGVLVFPSVVKGGFIVGAEYGAGALRVDGKTAAYYNTAGASYGFQAGVESYSYALFFITDSAVDYLSKSHGLSIGAGPTLTVVDAGVAKNLSTTTLKEDIYAFIFGQKGLMGGVALHGTKITEINPDS
jgi:lipid-binding SYLF domain-containing protein